MIGPNPIFASSKNFHTIILIFFFFIHSIGLAPLYIILAYPLIDSEILKAGPENKIRPQILPADSQYRLAKFDKKAIMRVS